MTRIDDVPLPPQRPLQQPRRARTRPFAIVAVLTCGLALGAGSLALGVSNLAAAAQEASHSGWRAGLRLAFVQRAAALLLDSVGATAAQESKAHDIIAATFTDLASDPKEAEALRKQALDLLGAPSIDRAAVEKLRADVVARFDAKSKKVVSAALDIADDLTPTQRAQLVERIGEMAQHGPMGGAMGLWRDGHFGHSVDDRPPDNSIDKD